MGPETLSVHGRNTRTNNAVESHNARLREMMGVSGNALSFTKKLRVVAQSKSNEQLHAVDGSAVKKRVKVEHANRANLISKLNAQLAGGLLASSYLHQVTSRLAIKSFEIDMYAAADEFQPVEEAHDGRNVLSCHVCQEARALRMALPCGHIILCKFCVEPVICTWEGCGKQTNTWHNLYQ